MSNLPSKKATERLRAALGDGATLHAEDWYSRDFLPHLDRAGIIQAITFRLADALPQEMLTALEQELAALKVSEKDKDVARRQKMESWMDAGAGCCALRHPAMAQVMQETLLRFNGERYQLIAWCIMPNHVHVLAKILPGFPLGKIVQSWKSYTGRWAMKHNTELGLNISGEAFWQREYWDRYIRSAKHLADCTDYIRQNPVKARLCACPEDWPWSSANLGAPPGAPSRNSA